MFPAPLFMVFLVLVSPLWLIFDGPMTYGVIAAAGAVLLIVIAERVARTA